MDTQLNIKTFISRFQESVDNSTFIKLTLSNKRESVSDLNNVYVKPVLIKERLLLSFTYRHKTRDITNNMESDTAADVLTNLLNNSFSQGFLATSLNDYQLLINKKGNSTLLQRPPSITVTPPLQHDKVKKRMLDSTNSIWMTALGILSKEGRVKPDMQDKYRQINKYVEIVNGIIKDIDLPEVVHVADMGSGKGYLTFALYDYLTNNLKKQARITGIEMRKDLVDQCNAIAQEAGFLGLNFKQGTIIDATIPQINILIALHACDTATDEAIYKGIMGQAQVIVCSPCCHKQVRKELETNGVLAEITQYGILAERQAEIITDTIRALMLEAYGYRTNIAEFIATEHTPKNLIISAVKKKLNPEYNAIPDPKVINNVNELKRQFNVRSHFLQELLSK